MYTQLFLAGIEARWDEGGGKYCWAITHAAGWACWGLSDSSVVELDFRLDPFDTQLLLTIRILSSDLCKIWLAPDLGDSNYCVNGKVAVYAYRACKNGIGITEIKQSRSRILNTAYVTLGLELLCNTKRSFNPGDYSSHPAQFDLGGVGAS
jgi:hypothetical protein